MAGSKTTNTAREVEMTMLSDIAQAKAAPDADLQFLVQLETMILNHLRSQFGEAAGAMDAAAGGGPPMGAPVPAPGPPPGLAGPGGLASQPSGPGGMPSMPPDIMAALAGGGGGAPPGPPLPPPGPPIPPQ